MAKAKSIKKVNVDKFAAAVQEALADYADYVDKYAVLEATHKTAVETADAIAAAAPKKTGAYSKSITVGYPERKNHKYKEIIYADDPHYRLTHLLERPHVIRRNGKIVGRTKAFPHWETGEKGVIERMISNLKEALK